MSRLLFTARWVAGGPENVDDFRKKESMSFTTTAKVTWTYLAEASGDWTNTMENWKGWNSTQQGRQCVIFPS